MDDWLLPTGGPAVLITVARGEGSVPREPGARMLVGATGQWGTVGGGHLELKGIEAARATMKSLKARMRGRSFSSARVKRNSR